MSDTVVVNGVVGAQVVVTGASGGVGRAVCRWLLDRGAQVFALDLHPARPEPSSGTPDDPANDVPGERFVEVDVTDQHSVEAAVAQVLQVAGRIDALVAAAGVSEEPTPFEELTREQWSRTVDVNLLGMFFCCQAVGRVMLAQGAGRIVTISSMSGNHVVNAPQQQAAYNASKAAVTALTKSIAAEWAPRGVRVNALAPGYIATPLLASKAEMHADWIARTPLGRMATPAEAAAAAGWLISDASDFCIGTELLMDGGYSLW